MFEAYWDSIHLPRDGAYLPIYDAAHRAYVAGWNASVARYPSLVLDEAQAEYLAKHLESAVPPTGEERIRRQRELYENAAKVQVRRTTPKGD